MNRFGICAMCGAMAISVWASDLVPTHAPDEAGSAMFTGRDLMSRLESGTNAPLREGAFMEPTAGPTAGTMPTLNEIMAAAPATNEAAALPGDVLAGKAYWGLMESDWGTQTGTMATRTLSAASATVTAGYYAATTLTAVDADLAAANIRYSTVVFGQTGTLRPALGDATAAQVLTGRTFTTNNSAQLTGTMANQAARGFMPGTANVTIPAGYYSGSGVVTGDADLVTANIRAGVNLFGVTGTPAVVNTASGTAVAGDLLSGETAYVNGSLVTGTMVTRTLSAASATVTAGYYAATTLTAVDADLAATNIRSGTIIFGQTGTLRPALGDATAAQVLTGRTFTTNNSAQLTGTMASNTLSAASATVSAGYYAATSLTNVDTDLKATNIAQGVTIFGVTGTVSQTKLPKTGWTNSYQTGDDGYYQKGAADPSPRFTIQANTNCVLDNRTGLIWARTSLTNSLTWSNAIVFCEALNYGGQTDWRLPNRFELESLLDLGQLPTLPAGHPFNLNHTGWNWSSSTYLTSLSTVAWVVSLYDARIGQVVKTTSDVNTHVWPVRGGQ